MIVHIMIKMMIMIQALIGLVQNKAIEKMISLTNHSILQDILLNIKFHAIFRTDAIEKTAHIFMIHQMENLLLPKENFTGAQL